MWRSHSDINPTDLRYTVGAIYLMMRYVPSAREKGFISYRIERSEIYRILIKIYRTSVLVYRK